MRLRAVAKDNRRVLDFDIENRPLSYLGQDFTTSEITAIAASFGPDEPMHCWLLGIHEPIEILEEFRVLFDEADMVTGHFIRNHDLPIINGAMLEYGLRPLGPKLTSDTKNDLVASKGVSRSQESISEMMALEFPKVGMSQGMWRAANRLERLDLTEKRVTGDVRQHQAMRARLIEQGCSGLPGCGALMDEVEVLNGTLREGDRVAVAVNGRGPSMRVGTVLEILPGIAGYNQRNGGIRVRVLVDKASGMTGQHYSGEAKGWEFVPFIKIYDDPMTMVKLGALQDAL